ncbi:MAG: glycosyltransferase family 2 protein [Desulfonatronovibrionaceae bacterium]
MNIAATGVVLTLNGEKWLEDCLKSLDFCCHLLVVDSGSEDKTADIARRCGAEVLVNPWPGPAEQFRFAFGQVSTEWVVSLDQDEILSDRLRQEIITWLSSESGSGFSGFFCSRKSYYFDRFLRYCGWYPDFLLRVFRVQDTDIHTSGPHYGFHSRGATAKLKGDIIHYPYSDLREHVAKMNYYSQVAAEEMRNKGKKSGLVRAFLHAMARFFKIYILKLGLLDGRAGFVLAVNSFFYTFQKYIRLMELNAGQKR